MHLFSITGRLPASWEDFFCRDGKHPHVTIMTRADAEDCGYEGDDPATDGWLDIVVDVDVIDLDVARLALAYAFGIDDPEDIVIDERGFCQAV